MYLDPLKIINTYRKNNNSKLNKSIIVSYRESSEERKYNLKCVLEYLSYVMDKESEIIIVEQDDTPKVDWLHEIRGYQFIKHIFIENDGIFNKGWGYNVGAKSAESDVLIFHDSDIFIKPQTFIIAIQSLKTVDVINPYQSVVFLDEESSKLFKEHKYSFAIGNKFKPVLHTIITGGIFFIKKQTFFKLKGFDEECYGYGHEDDILDEKIRKLGLNVKTLNDVSIHMYHETVTNSNDLYYSFVEINKQLFAEYVSMTQQQILNKIENIEVWGDVDDYQSDEKSMRHIKRAIYEKTSEKIIEHVLSKFTEDYMDEIVNNISTKIYNDIVEVMAEKVKQELNSITYSNNEKQSMLRNIMKKFRL